MLSSLLLALWSHIKSHNCCPMNIQWSNPNTLVDLFCVSSFFLISGLSLLWEKLLSLSLQLPSLFVCVGCEMPAYSYIPFKLLPSVVLWISCYSFSEFWGFIYIFVSVCVCGGDSVGALVMVLVVYFYDNSSKMELVYWYTFS